MRLDEILSPLVVIVAVIIAVILARKYGATPHKFFARLVAANIALDFIAVVIWGGIPALQWSIYRLGFAVVGAEAVLAAGLFALTLVGLIRSKKWAPFLAIAITVAQRVFAAYVFSVNIATGLTLTWSLLIIYFAYRETRTSQKQL
jgi:hypothetical protein